jgi:hypothetical protein
MVKLVIHALPCESDEILTSNRAAFPSVPHASGSGVLAVVGGGLSTKNHIDELREWPGDVWAVNHTARWLRDHGVDCLCYTVDPSPMDKEKPSVCGKAVLADHCDPSSVDAADSVVKVTPPFPGPTSATAASLLSLKCGYDGAVFFGCESSYGETTHVDRNDDILDLVRVECGGEYFMTRPELILQAEQLASVIHAFPDRFSEKSGGFLRALINNKVYNPTHMTRYLWEKATHEKDFQ